MLISDAFSNSPDSKKAEESAAKQKRYIEDNAVFGILQDTLRKPVHEALNQRITVRYNYEGLSDAEVPEYIRHKLKSAGAASSVINDAALSAIHGYVQGNPRIIDNLMTDALNIGAQLQKKVIDEEVILAAVSNQNPFA